MLKYFISLHIQGNAIFGEYRKMNKEQFTIYVIISYSGTIVESNSYDSLKLERRGRLLHGSLLEQLKIRKKMSPLEVRTSRGTAHVSVNQVKAENINCSTVVLEK